MNLIQLAHPEHGRRVALVQEDKLVLLHEIIRTTYALFDQIIHQNNPASEVIKALILEESIAYDPVYNRQSDWRILPPMDTPDNPMNTILSGTGLTHKASAQNRNKMHKHLHEQQKAGTLTDSMRMYLWGEEGGKPPKGEIGVQPEWFFKGNGHVLRGHRDTLDVPAYAENGGEEPEIAGIYLVSKEGIPFRIGFTQANEFSDHVMEKRNYLYLAPSKLRTCSIGPELVLEEDFKFLEGKVSVKRAGKDVWSKAIQSGEEAMAHSLENLEYHHFKYEQHRLPGQLHIHFFGTGAFSFGDQVFLEQGDEMEVTFEGMGRPLLNKIEIDGKTPEMFSVKGLS